MGQRQLRRVNIRKTLFKEMVGAAFEGGKSFKTKLNDLTKGEGRKKRSKKEPHGDKDSESKRRYEARLLLVSVSSTKLNRSPG